MYKYLTLLAVGWALVGAAPYKSKNKKYDGPQLVYDQKQTGDYNIQLHLKDFQIIALLGDDSLGDYEYDYDYADFTIKPSGSPSTSTSYKPSTPSPSTSSTTQNAPSSTSQLPSSSTPIPASEYSTSESQNLPSSEKAPSSTMISNSHPYPIEIVETSEDASHKLNFEGILTAVDLKSDEKLSSEASTNEISSFKPLSSTSAPSTSPSKIEESFSSPQPSPESPPGKIKVQILESPASLGTGAVSIGIVPGEDVQGDANDNILNGELASYRKCSSGFSRDKKGRCRRVRRPGSSQLPFGFGRIASNLATRLRLTPKEIPSPQE